MFRKIAATYSCSFCQENEAVRALGDIYVCLPCLRGLATRSLVSYVLAQQEDRDARSVHDKTSTDGLSYSDRLIAEVCTKARETIKERNEYERRIRRDRRGD